MCNKAVFATKLGEPGIGSLERKPVTGADEVANRLHDLVCRFENIVDGAGVKLQPILHGCQPETGVLKGEVPSIPPFYRALHEKLDRFETGIDILDNIIARVDM